MAESGDGRRDASSLLRFERAVARRVALRVRWRTVVASAPAIVQIAVAATVGYAIARFGLGHPAPLLAVTVTITSLGLQRDARPRRVLDTVVGILIGITLSEVLVLLVGSGVWQIAVVLVATLLIARFVSSSPGFAVAAAVQSMLVLLVPAPPGGPFLRTVDGLIGGLTALAVTAMIPRDPAGAARREERALLSTLAEALDALEAALRHGDEPAADLALTRLRRTQPLLDAWSESLEGAIAVARISPFLRRQLPALRDGRRLHTGLDLAARHLRVLTRRVDYVVRDGVARPSLADLVAELAAAIAASPRPSEARARLLPVAERLSPAELLPDAPVTESVLVLLVRPLVVDLLVATGLDLDEARALLPAV